MKRLIPAIFAFAVLLSGCAANVSGAQKNPAANTKIPAPDTSSGINIVLSDTEITVDGAAISKDPTQAVYAANDIVFYPEGQDFTYGEGTKTDEHSQEEADKHTVVHISKPGTYIVCGTLSAGQVAIDLGDDADEDSSAVVNLVLDGADITCTVAPAIIFYNVYECGSDDTEEAIAEVDTSKAGANVIIADGSENNISGSYVARIYKPGSVELSEDGTEVLDSKKLHKYDAAFYSKMSMNVFGGEKGTGVLNILADNEGLDSELHLTINGGNINIESGNDGINTNEDGVSVTTINGGSLNILVNGATGEGDGIDSNGWLVINGGSVNAQACATSGDAGIDSDMGIYINGGTVAASGNMLDAIAGGNANYAVFQFSGRQSAGTYTLKSDKGYEKEISIKNDFSYLIISGNDFTEGEYTLWCGDTQFAGVSGGNMGHMGGGMKPEGGMRPEGEFGGNGQVPTPPDGEMPDPENMPQPDGEQGMPPEGAPGGEWDGEMPDGMPGQFPGMGAGTFGEVSEVFVISKGGNVFANVGLSDGKA